MKHALPRLVLAILTAGTLHGCVTSTGSHPSTRLEQQSAPRMLSEARAFVRKGNPSAAIPRLQELMARFPDSEEAVDARYFLASAYGAIEDYADAIALYRAYLEVAPSGEYADESRRLLGNFREVYEQRYAQPEDLDEEIDSLRQQLTGDPRDLDPQKRLADRLWLRGRYQEAAEVYAEVLESEPAFKNDPTFIRRIDLHSDGSYTALTPEVVDRREIARNPVSFVNLSSFAAGRDRRTQIPTAYVVTGQVVNRSDTVLTNVQIITTIFGFGNQVYDTGTYGIGRLFPGETRAFSMRFGNFREIQSIGRYECTVSFQR